MDDFRVAGSTSDESDERTLNQVVRIAGYTSTIKQLVDKSFRFCKVHGTPVPKAAAGRKRAHPHEACAPGVEIKRGLERPRASLPRTRSL